MSANQPYKVCSRCGQPAVLQMVQCGRCGLPFAQPSITQSAFIQPPLSAASQREIARAAPAASHPRRFGALIGFLAIALVAAAATFHLMRNARSALGSTASIFSGAAPGSGTMRDPTAGLFHERPGSQEQPILMVGNGSGITLTLTLRAENGKEYRITLASGREGQLQVPAGQYDLHIGSSVFWVQDNHGDATFRRYKEYDAYFTVGGDAPPIHLGD